MKVGGDLSMMGRSIYIFASLIFLLALKPDTAFSKCTIQDNDTFIQKLISPGHVQFFRDRHEVAVGRKKSRSGGFTEPRIRYPSVIWRDGNNIETEIRYTILNDQHGVENFVFFFATRQKMKGHIVLSNISEISVLTLFFETPKENENYLKLQYKKTEELNDILEDIACFMGVFK